ncbi:MAG TPA: IS1182 family transposase [Gammaproteobacteria bacterium]|nr:IS1182 family transposase [Gammaproteobacteria bacterium]
MRHQHKRGLARTQTALLPPAVEDYVEEHALVRVIDLYVNGLNMVALKFKHSVVLDEGRPPYAPDDLLKLYLYGYWNRIRTSRKLEAECKRNLEVMWLLGTLVFDHKTIADFRRDNAKPFKTVCAQFVQFLREAQLVGGEAPVVAVDGSKFKASASKASMVNAEQAAKQREKIEARVAEYLKQLDEADRQSEGEPAPARIEAALKRLRERDEKLKQAQAQLAARAETAGKDETPRVGLSDPDCVMLTGKGTTVAGYNVQQAVDTRHKLIVAHEVGTQRNDHRCLEPMASAAQQALKAESLTAIADTGYMNGEQAQACEDRKITPVVPMPNVVNTRADNLYPKTQFVYDKLTDTYRCPAGQLLSRYKRDQKAKTDYYWTHACMGCAMKLKCTTSKRRSIARSWYADAAERAHLRAQDRRFMRLRSATVEHPFGNLKAMMPGGLLLRTLPKVQGEMALTVLTYNLKRTLNILGFEQLMQKLQIMVAPRWA